MIEGKKLARLIAGHPFPMVGPTSSVAGPTFLHMKTLTPRGLPQPGKIGQGETIRACAKAVGYGVNFFLVYRRCNINGSLGPDEVSENMFGVEYKHVHSV